MQPTYAIDEGETGPARDRLDLAPLKIGRFVVLGQLGAGGMGVVYAAYDPELDRKVAVKLLHPSLSGSDREDLARARLLREAQALARLSHPNVVAIYDVGTHEGQVFLAMELIAGDSLTTWLRARERTVRDVLDVFLEAGRGLAAAHREGLVHGDFKPDNVLVDRAGRVRVVDFGLAFAQDGARPDEDAPTASRSGVDLSTPLARPGALVGTPAYLSPEQFLGQPGSARSDQWAFCVALHEGLYGQRPFVGDDVPALKWAICQGTIPDEPRDRRMPTWLRRILLRGLQFDPAQRFADMDQLLAALARDPGRQRQRALLIGLAVVGLAGAALGYRWALVRAAEQRQGLCSAAADNLTGIWDQDRKDRVQRALLATGVAYAEDTWGRVAARLDAHTDAWVRMHTEACQATHLRGEQSEALLDLRMACLQRRLTEVDSLVDVLVDADAGVVERAAEAVAGLPDLGACADAAALLGSPAAPSPEQAAALAAIRTELAQARALESTARYAAGLTLAEAARARARELGDRAVLAEATLMHGTLLAHLGDARAPATLTDAFHTAEATTDGPLLARAALELMYVATTRLDLTAAAQWSRHARALLDRLGDGAPDELEAEYFNVLGTLHVHTGELEAAEAEYRRALALRQRATGATLKIAGIYNNLGNLLVRRGALDQAAEALERSAALYGEELGPSHPSVAIPWSNLGEVFGRRGEWTAAQASYRRARTILVAALGPEHFNVGVVDNNLGDVAQHLGDHAEAARRYGHADAVFTRSFGADAAPRAYPLTGLGESALAQGRVREARELLEQALALRDAGSPTDLARTKLALGRALAGDPATAERAAALATEARDVFAAAGPAYARELAAAEAWLGERRRAAP